MHSLPVRPKTQSFTSYTAAYVFPPILRPHPIFLFLLFQSIHFAALLSFTLSMFYPLLHLLSFTIQATLLHSLHLTSLPFLLTNPFKYSLTIQPPLLHSLHLSTFSPLKTLPPPPFLHWFTFPLHHSPLHCLTPVTFSAALPSPCVLL